MLSAEDKIIRGKVQLYRKNPFFAYLILHLKPIKSDIVPTMGVSARNKLYYNEEFVKKLIDEDLMIVLTHEILHINLFHLTRRGKRDPFIWNLATDLVCNKIIELNWDWDFKNSIIEKDGITEKTLKERFGIEIRDVEKKFAEEVYDILYEHFKKNKAFAKFVKSYKFDEHFDLDSLSEEEKKELERKFGKPFEEIKKDIENEIRKRLTEAKNFAKLRGNVPKGMEIIFDKLLKFKLNWKAILRKTISSNIPFDFSYKYPSRKSIAVGTYLPTTIKDKKLECVCVVDLSGSISQEEMREFMTEVYNIVKSFKNVRMWLITHDYEPQDFFEIKNGCLNKLLGIKLHGGGGTSHASWLPQYLKEKAELRNVKLIICFTDGYSDIEELKEEDFVGKQLIWVLCKNSIDEKEIPFGKVIKL